MSPGTKTSKKSSDKKSAAKAAVKKVPAKKPAAKAAVKKAPVKKSAAKAAVKKAPVKKAAAKAPAKKAPVKKPLAKKAPVKAPAKKTPAPKAPAKVATKKAPEKAPDKKAAAGRVAAEKVDAPKKAAVEKPPSRPLRPDVRPSAIVRPKRVKPTVGPYASDAKFLEEQRLLLLEERAIYKRQADDLRAEAESLALEREPGDVQFDEESGEGGTIAVDRERDLTLSAQAMATIEEIDDALATLETKAYGTCENCQQPIPKARLRALPYARLCIACKSGGLHRR